MRATRDLLRRRVHLLRTRAELLPPIQHPNRQYNLPELGQKLADNANHDGVAERCSDPAGQKRIAVARARLGHDDELRRAVALSIRKAAKQHHANTRSLRRTVPGSGERLRLVLRDEMHAIQRCPRGQDFVSSCRLVQCAKASAGTRDGPAGTQMGHASLPWAVSEAAVRFLRANPPGQTYRGRLANTHGTGKALTVLAHTRARAVYDMGPRHTAGEMPTFLTG